ncbi:hypothetical protein QNE85_004093, partial [Vibrio fluvialis]|nr:hypothetical protein [Vibrio fluvialis]
MPKFGLVGEGRTDHAVLHNILLAYFDGLKGGEIGRAQPSDRSDRNEGSQGNWLEVLKYLESSRFIEDLEAFDYLIVQIDTDIADEKHAAFTVRDEEGNKLSDVDIVNNVVSKLVEKINSIGTAYFDSIKDQIIFAVT